MLGCRPAAVRITGLGFGIVKLTSAKVVFGVVVPVSKKNILPLTSGSPASLKYCVSRSP